MHDLIHGIGIISIIIIIIYLVFWFDRRNKPSDFDLVRNHLQKITHPHLKVLGHGRYYIEYKDRNDHVFQYYHSGEYEKWLAHYKECEDINIIQHGLSSYRAWEKWGIKK
ncbi:hypothetical protein [Acinetobacter bereziniae]|uniref:hypothetical protein n=1 Tax=Acinetobacter bereziniae TaxID=106648 RepID=UPI00300AB1B4